MRGSVAAQPLLTRQEQLLYGRLVRAFPGHIVLSRVELSRLLLSPCNADVTGADVPGTPAVTAAPAITGRARQFIADFVVCRSDFSALAVLELDETNQPRESVRERNRRKDRCLQAAGIKVIHVTAGDLPDEAALKALVAAHPLHSSTAQLVRRAS